MGNMTEDTSQPEAKKQKNNSDRNVKISQPLSNSAVYAVQSPTVIQSLPKLAISSPTTPLTRPLLNSLTLPSTVTYLSFPLTTNGHLVPTLASLPRIAPKPRESLLATPKTTNQSTGASHVTNILTNQNTPTTTQHIKTESEEEQSVEKN